MAGLAGTRLAEIFVGLAVDIVWLGEQLAPDLTVDVVGRDLRTVHYNSMTSRARLMYGNTVIVFSPVSWMHYRSGLRRSSCSSWLPFSVLVGVGVARPEILMAQELN